MQYIALDIVLAVPYGWARLKSVEGRVHGYEKISGIPSTKLRRPRYCYLFTQNTTDRRFDFGLGRGRDLVQKFDTHNIHLVGEFVSHQSHHL